MLPISSTWLAAGLDSPRKINERYLQLVRLLGASEGRSGRGRDGSGDNVVDVNFVVLREPLLLCVPKSVLASRLVRLATTVNEEAAADGGGLSRVIEKQPSILLRDMRSSAADGEDEWQEMIAVCERYHDEKGDLHVSERLRLFPPSSPSASCSASASTNSSVTGAISSSSPQSSTTTEMLASWIRAQRKQRACGELEAWKSDVLEKLGVEWDADDAEWEVMFQAYVQYRRVHGLSEIVPYNTNGGGGGGRGGGGEPAEEEDVGALWHWCSVQRVSSRNGVMSVERKRRLDEVGFDFSGVDAAHA